MRFLVMMISSSMPSPSPAVPDPLLAKFDRAWLSLVLGMSLSSSMPFRKASSSSSVGNGRAFALVAAIFSRIWL
jgi:hypothetical protein